MTWPTKIQGWDYPSKMELIVSCCWDKVTCNFFPWNLFVWQHSLTKLSVLRVMRRHGLTKTKIQRWNWQWADAGTKSPATPARGSLLPVNGTPAIFTHRRPGVCICNHTCISDLRRIPMAGNYHKCKRLRFEDGVSRTKCNSFHLWIIKTRFPLSSFIWFHIKE